MKFEIDLFSQKIRVFNFVSRVPVRSISENMLRIVYRNKARRMSKASGRDELFRGLGPQGRIDRLRKIVTALIRHERLEGSWNFFDEARTYAELVRACVCVRE